MKTSLCQVNFGSEQAPLGEACHFLPSNFSAKLPLKKAGGQKDCRAEKRIHEEPCSFSIWVADIARAACIATIEANGEF